MRPLWYETHLLEDPAGKAARQRCTALGAATHEEILRIGDRLARESATLAQHFYLRAAEAHEALGRDFARWLALGEQLASGEHAVREGATVYFDIDIARAAQLGLDDLERWTAVARALAPLSRKLAAIFCEATAPLLGRVSVEKMAAFADIAARLHTQHGWHGEFLAQAYLRTAPQGLVVLSAEHFSLWAGLGATLRRVVKEGDFYAELSPLVRRWSDADRSAWLRCALSVAADSPKVAARFYREVPRALRRVPAARRTQLLAALQRAGRSIAGALDDLIPVLGAVVLDIAAEHREAALGHAQQIAGAFPRALPVLLRSLPKAYEETSAGGVAGWVARGVAIAQENADAGLAYFALESRTSVKLLHAGSPGVALEEVQGVLRKVIQMLSGTPASIRTIDTFCLRLPLEEFPAENEVALPLRIDRLATHEDNARLYRVLAAWLAGRREFGTYDLNGFPVDDGTTDLADGGALLRYLRNEEKSDLLEELFLLTDGYRIARRIVAEYSGLTAEFEWAATRLITLWTVEPEVEPDSGTALDATLAVALTASLDRVLPQWLRNVAEVILPYLAPLAVPGATAADALRIAEALTARLLDPNAPRRRTQEQFEFGGLLLDSATGATMIDPYEDDEAPFIPDAEAPRVPVAAAPQPEGSLTPDTKLQLDHVPDDLQGGAQPLSLDELRRLLEMGVNLKISQGTGEETDGIGLYITDLMGKIPSEQIEALRKLLGDPERGNGHPRRWLEQRSGGQAFLYDEWDYHIGDYRPRWCTLHEVGIDGDGGEFFNEALIEYAAMIPGIRQQFQRIRPEMYRMVRGLEDGEDFDLNAAVNARIETKARRSPSSKLYVARKREERDVATLFLVDMSASTDEPMEKAEKVYPPDDDDLRAAFRGRSAAAPPAPRRIIDVTKEALVIMAEALEEIGDAYAIYGFSGQGRQNVEFYLVKSFTEQLSAGVKGRIGGIEPKRSTRMGTALRHAIEKMNAVTARSKHLILLSDGFPQDFDYGQDRRSNVYGIRDTTVALRETEAAGITPFCITVDRAGHDYLRQMCDESRYLVIEDIATLPRELPKIYQRVVRTD